MHNIYKEGEHAPPKATRACLQTRVGSSGPYQPGGDFAVLLVRMISLTALASQAWGGVPHIIH